MRDFEYFSPERLEEAFAFFRRYGEKARLLAGGTELINELRSGKSKPEAVIDLKRVPGLDFVEKTEAGLRIGALFRVRDAERSGLLRDGPFSALSQAAGTLGSPQVRNKATIVGNVCRASPSADLIPPLMALDAMAKIVGNGVEKTVKVQDMLLGPGKTILKPGEIVTELSVPEPRGYTGCCYYKLSPRKSLDLAVVGVAVMLRTDVGISKCFDARVVLGAVGPTTMRASKAEGILVGRRLSLSRIEQAARAASEESRPLDDVRGSTWYRKKMVEVVVRRAIWLSLGQIRSARDRGNGEDN